MVARATAPDGAFHNPSTQERERGRGERWELEMERERNKKGSHG